MGNPGEALSQIAGAGRVYARRGLAARGIRAVEAKRGHLRHSAIDLKDPHLLSSEYSENLGQDGLLRTAQAFGVRVTPILGP